MALDDHPRDPTRSELEAQVEEEFERIEAETEHRFSLIAVIIAMSALALSLIVALSYHLVLGAVLMGVSVVFGGYHLVLMVTRVCRTFPLRRIRLLSVTIEVTLPAVASFLDIIYLGPVYALTSTPPMLTFIAVMASGFRLSRRLSLYAGILATVEYAAVYAFAYTKLDGATIGALPSLSIPYAVVHAGFLLATGLAAMAVAHLAQSVARRAAGQILERARVARLFGEYVSPAAMDKVLGGDTDLAGERRTVTILFVDIRGFTSLSFGTDPATVVAYLDKYFSEVCEVVTRHGGMIDKLIGDGLLAVFGALDDGGAHADAALDAALDMVPAARGVVRPDGEPTRIGVGLHTGPVIMGSMGARARKDFTVIGDTVNLASRIEGLTSSLGAPVLLSRAVADTFVTPHPLVPVGEHLVKGRDEPVALLRPDHDFL